MIHQLATARDLDRALAEPLAVVYKHSPRCGVCIAAEREVTHFSQGQPAVPVYWLDVVADRPLAQLVAGRVGVEHESPQVILLAAGRVVWAASHWAVRAHDLEEQVARVPTG